MLAFRTVFAALRTARLPLPLVAIVAGLFLSGCGVNHAQFDAAGSFAKSASALADGAKTAYAQTAQDERDVRFVKFVFGTPQEIRAREYATPLVDLSKDKIKGRLAAAAALSAYGQALTTLLDSKTQEDDFSTATTKLAGAIKGLPGSVLRDAGISAADIDGFGKIIIAFGNLYLDYRRREILEQVVPQAEPMVTKICRMFGKDFDVRGGLLGSIVRKEIRETFVYLHETLKDRSDDMQARVALLPLYQRMDTLQAKVLQSFGSLKEAADSCAKTSIEFAKAIKEPTWSLDDIIDFAAKAQAAYDTVHAVSGAN